jgi:hypothetical protein
MRQDEGMSEHPDGPRLYREFASWFHLLTSPQDYSFEADFYSRLLTECAAIPVETVLELGSGGGNNASHMKSRFQLTLTEPSEEMLELSRSINPECEHIQGDMRTLRLGRQFDGVFVHDAVSYMTTEDDLRAAIVTGWEHCKPGGAVVFAPDAITESFRPNTDHGGHDGTDRALRYLEWAWDPDPRDTTYVTDYAFLLRDSNGDVRAEYDRHTCGLFSRATWLKLLEETGFRAEHRDGVADETALDIFLGAKPLWGVLVG